MILLRSETSGMQVRSKQGSLGAGLGVVTQLVSKQGGRLYAKSRHGGATVFGVSIPNLDLGELRKCAVSISGADAEVEKIRKLSSELKLRLTSKDESEVHIDIVTSQLQPSHVHSHRSLIATYDRSREFRRTWQEEADAFLYLPATHESLLRAIRSAEGS